MPRQATDEAIAEKALFQSLLGSRVGLFQLCEGRTLLGFVSSPTQRKALKLLYALLPRPSSVFRCQGIGELAESVMEALRC